jgi:hypothetical protein
MTGSALTACVHTSDRGVWDPVGIAVRRRAGFTMPPPAAMRPQCTHAPECVPSAVDRCHRGRWVCSGGRVACRNEGGTMGWKRESAARSPLVREKNAPAETPLRTAIHWTMGYSMVCSAAGGVRGWWCEERRAQENMSSRVCDGRAAAQRRTAPRRASRVGLPVVCRAGRAVACVSCADLVSVAWFRSLSGDVFAAQSSQSDRQSRPTWHVFTNQECTHR